LSGSLGLASFLLLLDLTEGLLSGRNSRGLGEGLVPGAGSSGSGGRRGGSPGSGAGKTGGRWGRLVGQLLGEHLTASLLLGSLTSSSLLSLELLDLLERRGLVVVLSLFGPGSNGRCAGSLDRAASHRRWRRSLSGRWGRERLNQRSRSGLSLNSSPSGLRSRLRSRSRRLGSGRFRSGLLNDGSRSRSLGLRNGGGLGLRLSLNDGLLLNNGFLLLFRLLGLLLVLDLLLKLGSNLLCLLLSLLELLLDMLSLLGLVSLLKLLLALLLRELLLLHQWRLVLGLLLGNLGLKLLLKPKLSANVQISNTTSRSTGLSQKRARLKSILSTDDRRGRSRDDGRRKVSRAVERTEARLAVEAVSRRSVVQLVSSGNLLGNHLLLKEKFALLGHDVLLLLLTAFEGVLLLGSQSRTESRESSSKRRLNASGSLNSGLNTWRLVEPWSWPISSSVGGHTRRRAWKRNQERLPSVTNFTNKISEGFEFDIFLPLDCKLSSEKSGAVPIVHLKTVERTLDNSRRVAVHPLNLVGHYHNVLLVERR
jgi:hypothetical protein